MTFSSTTILGRTRPADMLVTCDHAGNLIPPEIGTLGLSKQDMARHIAYDIGAAGVSVALAEALNAPVILNHVSRLVIDANRGADDPTLVMRLYDGTIIEGNRHVDTAEVERRRLAYHAPYHQAAAALLDARDDPVMIAIHSFTPQLAAGPPRPWHIGVLHTGDTRLSTPLLAALRQEGDLIVGDNEPYVGYLPGDSVDQHASAKNRLNALIEIRNDLIETEANQKAWAHRLAPILEQVITKVRHDHAPSHH